MDAVSADIAHRVVDDIRYFTAIIGLIGVVIGSVITVFGNILLHHLRERAATRGDKERKQLLREMLCDESYPDKWRSLDTLMHVIGSSDEKTKALLLQIGARASEDGQSKWGLIKYHPLRLHNTEDIHEHNAR